MQVFWHSRIKKASVVAKPLRNFKTQSISLHLHCRHWFEFSWKSGAGKQGRQGRRSSLRYFVLPGTRVTDERCRLVFLSGQTSEQNNARLHEVERRLTTPWLPASASASNPDSASEASIDADMNALRIESNAPPQAYGAPHELRFTSASAHGQSCGACGKSGVLQKLQLCTRCKKVWYCGKECQLGHWRKGHKKECSQVASQR